MSDNPQQKISDYEKEILSFLRTEYTELMGELRLRINLQSSVIQRVLSFFGIATTIAIALSAVLLKESDAAKDIINVLDSSEFLLLTKATFVLIAGFCLIALLLICNWIYHLYLIFRIHRFSSWLGEQAENVLGNASISIFRYQRQRLDQSWAQPYKRKRFRYLQAAVLYSLVFCSVFALYILLFNLWCDSSSIEKTVGIFLIALLSVLLVAVLWIHVSLHHIHERHEL